MLLFTLGEISMKSKIFILCASLLLNSTSSFASLGKHGRDESESSSSRPAKKAKVSPQAEKVKEAFVQADLGDLFLSEMDQALNTMHAGNFMYALSFLFDNAENVQIRTHSHALKTLRKQGLFKDLENEVSGNKEGQGFHSKAFTTTFKMIDLSDHQSDMGSNRHHIFFHNTGLLLRLKPLEKQYSFSFYTKNATETVLRGNAEEIQKLFADKKQRAEAFKLYLHKTNEGDVFAIPVPRDPGSTVSLKSFVGAEQFEQIAPKSMGQLSQHLKYDLIGTLGHRKLYELPIFKQLALSRKENTKPEFDLNSEKAFPLLGVKKAKVEATSSSAPKPTALAPASNADNDFDFSDQDTFKERPFNVNAPEYSFSSSSASLASDENENNENFDFSGTYTPGEEYYDMGDPTYVPYSYIPPYIYDYAGNVVPNPYFPGGYQPYQVAYEG